MNTREELEHFKPIKEFFVGIDSDGTAFDSMNIKHLKAFIPAALQTWEMGAARENFEKTWKDINLYSPKRGINRFAGLVLAFDTLQHTGIDPGPLKAFVETSETLSNAALHSYMETHSHPFLEAVYRWSLEADILFEKHTQGLLPFAQVPETLRFIAERADIMVVSSASGKGLDKDWSYSGLSSSVVLVAGQETGNKKTQLRLGAQGKYPAGKILMVGDAPGDLEAAEFINTRFYPIIPGREEDSWLRLREESLGHFFGGTYQGNYENRLIEDFLKSLHRLVI